jgi:hypothetical protein
MNYFPVVVVVILSFGACGAEPTTTPDLAATEVATAELPLSRAPSRRASLPRSA